LNVYSPDWKGPNPFFLVIREYAPDHRNRSTVIDLDSFRWHEVHADLMRLPRVWMLCSKEQSEAMGQLFPLLIIEVLEGEQPYYVRKTVGIISMSTSEGPSMHVHGIGKKRLDGHVDRLWLLPNGMATVGEDVYPVADRMNKGYL
jgi:hypothetical protein